MKKKILIAETSVLFCEQLTSCLTDDYAVRMCHSGLEAQRILTDFQPDVLVMDVMLPELDGISLLKFVSSQPHRPNILLTTCLLSAYVEAAIRSYSVDMVMVKPCDPSVIAERVRDLSCVNPETPVQLPKKDPTLSDVLLHLDIPSKRKAFAYLQMSVELYEANPCQGITKRLYPAVAAAYRTNPVAVERAIRQVVHEAWERRNDAIWRQYFQTDRSGCVPRPTNAEFISQLAEVQRKIAQ